MVVAERAVLTAGVMIALALVPASALVSLSIVAADWSLASAALLRFGVDVALVAAVGGAVLGIKQRVEHGRRALEPRLSRDRGGGR